MPKIDTIQTNFSAGEISPQGEGRTDIARYANAAKRMINVISRTLGGAQKRPGTQFIAATRYASKRSRLIPFIVNRNQAYMVEAGDLYVRIFKTDGTMIMDSGSPYQVATPYTETYVQELDYTQGEDGMFIFHQSVYPQRLRTFADTKWDCSAAPFTTTPFDEMGAYPAANLTLASNTVGTGKAVTADAAVFLASDVGRAILWNAGILVITAYTDTTHVTGEIKVVFDAATIPSGLWNLDSSPQATLTPGAKSPVGASASLVLSAAGWRTTDVGKYCRINSGMIKITSVTDTTNATGTIVKELTAVTAAPALAWTLETSMWGGASGYPRTGTFHQQRLVVAGTKSKPMSIAGSKSGEPLDFTKGTNDDDTFVFTIATTQETVGPINHIFSMRDLAILSDGGEFSVRGGTDKPLTPTNVQCRSEGSHASNGVKPVTVGKEVMFAQRASRKVRAMSFRFDEDGYKSPDITTLAAHITETGIAGMAFQQEPDPIVWICLKNGRLISVTIDRELDIIAWNRHELDGGVESIATVPDVSGEQVWMIVRRVINGSVARYVERMQPNWYPIYGTTSPDANAFPIQDEPKNWGFTLDCAVTMDDATGKATWTGLGHLEGKTVRCVADGCDMGEFTVTSGAITLSRTAKRVLIGIFFAPEIVLLTPEMQSGDGTSQGAAMSVSNVGVRVVDTIGAIVDGNEILHGRIIGPDQLDKAPELFTGTKYTSNLGWKRGVAETTITQDAPFPFFLLSVIRTITINKG